MMLNSDTAPNYKYMFRPNRGSRLISRVSIVCCNISFYQPIAHLWDDWMYLEGSPTYY